MHYKADAKINVPQQIQIGLKIHFIVVTNQQKYASNNPFCYIDNVITTTTTTTKNPTIITIIITLINTTTIIVITS